VGRDRDRTILDALLRISIPLNPNGLPTGETTMSFRSSLNKFRPILERCEARDLAAATVSAVFYDRVGVNISVEFEVKYRDTQTRLEKTETSFATLTSAEYKFSNTYPYANPEHIKLFVKFERKPGESVLNKTGEWKSGFKYDFLLKNDQIQFRSLGKI
jgi:hypothetical protein